MRTRARPSDVTSHATPALRLAIRRTVFARVIRSSTARIKGSTRSEAFTLTCRRHDAFDPDQSLEEAIAADNACLEAAGRHEVTLGIHLCRGNSRSRWLAEGSYDPIAEKLFGSLEADRFLLEYDSERSGGFAPLRFVPKGKSVALGLITTKAGELELQDELLRRIEEASAFVSLENLAISPQCGFASSAPGNLISYDAQRRKLELVADTARKVWGENR